MLDQLDPIIAQLEADKAVLEQRLDLLRQLRATFIAERPPASAPAAAPPTQRPAAREPRTKSRTRAKPAGGQRGTVDYDEVARVIKEARAKELVAWRAVAEHFGISESNARFRVSEAGRRGLVERGPADGGSSRRAARRREAGPTEPIDWDLPGGRARQSPVVAPPDKVYRCDCGVEVATENELGKHTRSAHDRLDYAITEGIKQGIWGGKSERERRNLRRGRPRAGTVDWDEVARVVEAAQAAGESARAAVAEHFGVTVENASYRVTEVRRRDLVRDSEAVS